MIGYDHMRYLEVRAARGATIGHAFPNIVFARDWIEALGFATDNGVDWWHRDYAGRIGHIRILPIKGMGGFQVALETILNG